MILSPTDESAAKMHTHVSSIGDCIPTEMRLSYALVGGHSVEQDTETLHGGVHIVSGTPGRVFDMIDRGALNASTVRLFALYRADEMLDRGFEDQVYEIFRKLPENVQVCLFSATFRDELRDMSNKMMDNPVRILDSRQQCPPSRGARHYYVAVEREEWKLDTLCDLFETLTIMRSIIYCNSRKKVDWLTQQLRTRDFTLSSLHGGTNETEYQLTVKDFQREGLRVLITTDGILCEDVVRQVPLVINYDLPTDREKYAQRTADPEGNRLRIYKGVVINFILNEDVRVLRDVEEFYSEQIEQMPMNIVDLI